MKKKVALGIIGLLLAVVAGVVLWPASPEYGASYSEQQRKLWNERRALIPVAWGIGEVFPKESSYLARIEPMDEARAKSVLEQKKILNDVLRKRQIELRDKENASFELTVEKNPGITSLRAHEITWRECLDRARGGDGDACLMMAWNMGWGKNQIVGRSGLLSWRREKDVGTWLSRTESAGRPGVLFLKHFCRMTQKESKRWIDKSSLSGYGYTITDCPDYTGLPGYDEFLKCMQSGGCLALPPDAGDGLLLCASVQGD